MGFWLIIIITTVGINMDGGILNHIWSGLTKEMGTFIGMVLFYLFVRTAQLSRRWFKRNSVTHQATQAVQIQELMLKLRLKVDADRVGVMQFMNGSHFLNKVSKYNLMCTHQSVRAGTANISLRTDESVLTQFPEFMKALLSGNCIKLSVEEVPDAVMQAALLRQGVTCMAAAPFFSKSGNIEGFLIVDHIGLNDHMSDSLCLVNCRLIEQAALQIGFELRR